MHDACTILFGLKSGMLIANQILVHVFYYSFDYRNEIEGIDFRYLGIHSQSAIGNHLDVTVSQTH